MNIESFPPYDPLPDGYRRESFFLCRATFVYAVKVFVCAMKFLFVP